MLGVLILGVALAQGPTVDGPPPNGAQLYEANCSECHGLEGDGVPNVDLGHGRFRRATTDLELVSIILRGIPNTAMPPSNFTEGQALAIVRFLREKGSRAVFSAGDAANGRALFTGKGNCVSCHRVNGIGARVGPDLSEIGRLRHSTDLERAIADPDATVLPSNRFVRAVTREGETVIGRLLNQDTFIVQLIDAKEQLRSLVRANLRAFTFMDKSPMPSYRDKLSSKEMVDVVSYLGSLRGGGTK
ncbi:MAG TPA: c-type cytochrome [Vicinamibacterales bacterium]|nr:c-type cytochrome [Vicinamibacterales bacterium]